MARDIHDYDSLKEAYGDLLMFERFPGPVRSERVEEFVIQLKRDIREYVNRVSDYRIVRDFHRACRAARLHLRLFRGAGSLVVQDVPVLPPFRRARLLRAVLHHQRQALSPSRLLVRLSFCFS